VDRPGYASVQSMDPGPGGVIGVVTQRIPDRKTSDHAMKLSAGVLLYRFEDGDLKVLLVHPGGPFFATKDLGSWSIPKGEYLDHDDPVQAAIRELREETGATVAAEDLTELGTVRQKGGKQVSAWCALGEFDVSTLVSNTFEMQWPPGSDTVREFPEVDRAEWFSTTEAKAKLNAAQTEFVDRLESLLDGPANGRATGPATDSVFAGSIPAIYEEYLVPLIFEPYAADLADRVASRPLTRLLEIAAGTGVATRRLASALPGSVSIVATDLNQGMLDQASEIGTARPVQWRQADALQLPFDDGAFDAVVCQFGFMFLPDKAAAFSEARRVLSPRGVLIFSVWDRIEENEFADTVTAALGVLFPEDPPRFLARTPHGYNDLAVISRDLTAAGFASPPDISTVAARSQAASARVPAIAYCQGSPLRNEIEAHGESRLAEATDIAAEAIARRFGPGAVDGKIQAHIVTVTR
jgi:predicted NUDIX family NTP pyrophosphohydrolase